LDHRAWGEDRADFTITSDDGLAVFPEIGWADLDIADLEALAVGCAPKADDRFVREREFHCLKCGVVLWRVLVLRDAATLDHLTVKFCHQSERIPVPPIGFRSERKAEGSTITGMERFTADKQQFVVVDDYGTGGIWGLIAAESADAITRRYSKLRVITIGDPAWVTAEKYSEIVSDWIKPSEHFDIDHPTGWLANWDERLSSPSGPGS
jgi:hypothetical protein